MIKEKIRVYDFYLITNKINNMQYVGKTTQGFRARFNQHFSGLHSDPACFFNFFCWHKRAYGKKNFNIVLLNTYKCTSKQSDEIEQGYIANLKTAYPNGYNLMGCCSSKVAQELNSKLLNLYQAGKADLFIRRAK